MMQPTKIPVHTGLSEGCIFKATEIAVTMSNAHAAQSKR